jgi:hypothetical protein
MLFMTFLAFLEEKIAAAARKTAATRVVVT